MIYTSTGSDGRTHTHRHAHTAASHTLSTVKLRWMVMQNVGLALDTHTERHPHVLKKNTRDSCWKYGDVEKHTLTLVQGWVRRQREERRRFKGIFQFRFKDSGWWTPQDKTNNTCQCTSVCCWWRRMRGHQTFQSMSYLSRDLTFTALWWLEIRQH